ncbi:MAG TPA: hypothetical protein VKA13_02525 [Gammaproteobacteria bacterium]|nr:hypothetical protein [Gammaproteobacteria bacterium]
MPKPPDRRSVELLADVLNQTCRSLEGLDAARYRAEHPDDLDRLDQLTNVEPPLLEVAESPGALRVNLLGLYFLDNKPRNALIDDIDHVLNYLRTQYREIPKAPVRLSDIAKDLRLNRQRVELCVHYAKTAAAMKSTPNLADAEASVFPSDELLQVRNIFAWLKKRTENLYREQPEPAPPPDQEPHGNVEKSAKRREVILAAALWVINNRYENCLQHGRLLGARIVDQIELASEGWWPDKAQMPARRTMVSLINKYLKKTIF